MTKHTTTPPPTNRTTGSTPVTAAIGTLLAIAATFFNVWVYRLEPTATVDPNDNAFQYALVHRTNDVWDWAASTKCPTIPIIREVCVFPWLIDHWVPNWAQGYNLPYYYSHMPQIAIVATWRMARMVAPLLTLFAFYHAVVYIALCLFPIALFAGLRVAGMPWLVAGAGALLSPFLSTDGLYGLDPPSFLWRGWGLSSQLFAMPFIPLALAYAARFITTPPGVANRRLLLGATVFLTLATAAHLGMGVMLFLALPFLAVTAPFLTILGRRPIRDAVPVLLESLKRTALLAAIPIGILSYWIVPTVLGNDYHNISVWDPIWKFDSYGIKHVLVLLMNGDLFDFGRLPILTALVAIGWFTAILSGAAGTAAYGIAFVGYLALFFGRTTWGPLIDLVPGMKEFHISRFIVGIHAAALFLMPLGLAAAADGAISGAGRVFRFRHVALPKSIAYATFLLLTGAVVWGLYPQTVRYAAHNDRLIAQANANKQSGNADEAALFATLAKLPKGRIYAGRGGNWGKDFRVAETPWFMHLSTFGYETVLWLPETWSPNSDTEQYFSDDNPDHYALFDIRYVVAPPSVEPKPFWILQAKGASWKLYRVASGGKMTVGSLPSVVTASKEHTVNLVRLWIQSTAHAKGVYPQLSLTQDMTTRETRPHFTMTDEATYRTPEGAIHSLFREPPVYPAHTGSITLTGTSEDPSGMAYGASVTVGSDCSNCALILKTTFHPGWHATVDGIDAPTVIAFPFFVAVPLAPGTHTVAVRYEPSGFKIFLFLAACIAGIGGFSWLRFRHPKGR